MLRTSNPALSEGTFFKYDEDASANRMTAKGAATKCLILLIFLLVPAAYSWHLAVSNPALAGPLVIGGAIGGFIVALITIFGKKISPFTSPIYAVLEGLCLGALSSLFEAQHQGIVIQAVGLTVGVLLTMLVVYRLGLIKVTRGFALGVIAATGAIALIYLVSFVLSFTSFSVPYIHGSGPFGIGFSVVVVIIAALNLVLDFDFIERGAERGLPKYMEWYAAFGLLVTLVWLYLEILRLLAKLRRR